MEKYFCEKCGKQLDIGDRFCRYCGSNLIKTVDDSIPDSPFCIEGGVLYGYRDGNLGLAVTLKRQKSLYEDSAYLLIKAIEDNPSSVASYIIEAYNKFKNENILNIPADVKRIGHLETKYHGVFEDCYFYKVNLPSEVIIDSIAFSQCYIHLFTLPKNCYQLTGVSIGEFSISPDCNYSNSIDLIDCKIGKFVVPSAVKRVIAGSVRSKQRPGDLVLSNCHIQELTISGYSIELLDWQKESVFTNTRIKVLNYPGYRSDIFNNNIVHFANKIVCRDGVISLRNVDEIYIRGDEYPSDTKMVIVKLLATNNAIHNSSHVIYYSGRYSGYILIRSSSFLREASFAIPDFITSLKIRRDKGNWVEFKRPYLGEWKIDISQLDSHGYLLDAYDPYNAK